MALECSDELKIAATNPSGSMPVFKLELYPVSGMIAESKGLKCEILDGGTIGSPVIWPPTGLSHYSKLVAYNWGDSPPLGISPSQLSDSNTWGMKLSGYFLCKRPTGYTGLIHYYFGYVAAGYASFSLDGDLAIAFSSPHSIKESTTSLAVTGEVWVPIEIYYIRCDPSQQNRRLKNERFTFFWKDDIDDEWRVLGADVTCPPGGKYDNLVGEPISSISAPSQIPNDRRYLLTIHKVGDDYHFHKEGDATQFPLVPGDQIRHNLQPGVAGGDFVDITWSTTVNNNDIVEVYLVSGNVDPIVLNVNSVSLDSSEEAASVLNFSVPVTTVAFDSDNVTKNNMYTYDMETDSFGVLRKNRLVKAYFGYRVSGQPEYVQRFTGLIQDVRKQHRSAGAATEMTLEVICFDARVKATDAPVKKIEDTTLGGLPNDLSYDIAGYFPEDDVGSGPDGDVRPHAYDRWNLAKVVRTVLYQNGFTSTQLWAKDANGNFLIDDRGVYLESTTAYPFSLVSQLGARSEVIETKNWQLEGFWWFIYEKEYTQKHWIEHAGSIDMPFIYQFGLDDDPWQQLVEICQGYGLELNWNGEGNVYMRYPNNPTMHNSETGDGDNNVAYDSSWDRVSDNQAVSNVFYRCPDLGGIASVSFCGVGIRLLFSRPDSNSRASVAVDDLGTVVNGVNILDDSTGDTGHTDWTDLVENELYVQMDLSDYGTGKSIWYWRDGLHPMIGKNPCGFTVCDNLTYGDHTVYIRNCGGTIYLEGFQVITRSTEQPQHEFDASKNLIEVQGEESLGDLINDATVMGNMTGAAGDYIMSRSVDLASISSEESPNYIGVRSAAYISSPKITNQERADFLSQYLMMRYRRGRRNPVLGSPGLPWLAVGDAVTIRDMKDVAGGTVSLMGYYAPADLTKEQRTGLGVLPVPFQRYWIRGIRDAYESGDGVPSYRSTVTATSSPPQPAYVPVPEPDQDMVSWPVTDINITIDGGGSTYNPYLEAAEGKYANIEFSLNWHARSLVVRVVAGEVIEPSGRDIIRPGTVINVLQSRTGFLPAGKYEFKWDGWMVTSAEGDGYYAPDAKYCFEIETERYSTGTCFACRAESGLPGVVGGSKEYIEIAQDRDAVYGADPFSVSVTPSGSVSSPPIIYDTQTNDGRGLKLTVHLDCPAQVEIPLTIRRISNPVSAPPNTGDDWFDAYMDKWIMYMREEGPILEPGDYVFYFQPGKIFKDGNIRPFVDYPRAMNIIQSKNALWVGWHIQLAHGVRFIDKAGVVTTEHPSCEHFNWGGAVSGMWYDEVKRNNAYIYLWFFKVKEAV